MFAHINLEFAETMWYSSFSLKLKAPCILPGGFYTDLCALMNFSELDMLFEIANIKCAVSAELRNGILLHSSLNPA